MSLHLGLTQRDKRTLAIGLSAVTLLVTFARGVPALRSWESKQFAAASSAANELAHLRDGSRELPEIRDSLHARNLRLAALDSVLLRGASPASIAAALASVIEEFAGANAIKVTTLQLRSDSAATLGLANVAVRLSGVTDVAGLAGFLRAVESDAMPLIVRELTVSQPEPTASDSKPETLRIDVTVASIGEVRDARVSRGE
jgi:Type II secretion system (T2SS), protein M subtype b